MSTPTDPGFPLDCPTLELPPPPPRGPWTVEIGDPERSQVLLLAAGERLVIGSACHSDAVVADRTVSARHAAIQAGPEGLRVEDLGSTNGLFVGGARVGSAWLCAASATFVVGRTSVTVRTRDPALDDAPRVASPVAGLVGESLPMRRLFADIRRCAPLRAPVLLQGESGTGKDVVARALHDVSGRRGAYVPLNVGAIQEQLADAELFGHRRGAFTGAIASRVGAFEAANGGTLFLDEIAELSPAIQVKLLRVVEEGRVRPLGGTESIDVGVRIVSATWAELAERVAAGRFREDLFHRITTFAIRLPPLRARKTDIPALSSAILSRVSDDVGQRCLDSGALARLVAHGWPGNVRELGAVLYRSAALSEGELILARHVDAAMTVSRDFKPRALSPDEAERLLGECAGNISAAARTAGIARSTFRAWLGR